MLGYLLKVESGMRMREGDDGGRLKLPKESRFGLRKRGDRSRNHGCKEKERSIDGRVYVGGVCTECCCT